MLQDEGEGPSVLVYVERIIMNTGLKPTYKDHHSTGKPVEDAKRIYSSGMVNRRDKSVRGKSI